MPDWAFGRTWGAGGTKWTCEKKARLFSYAQGARYISDRMPPTDGGERAVIWRSPSGTTSAFAAARTITTTSPHTRARSTESTGAVCDDTSQYS
jgi:hypothetical protein